MKVVMNLTKRTLACMMNGILNMQASRPVTKRQKMLLNNNRSMTSYMVLKLTGLVV